MLRNITDMNDPNMISITMNLTEYHSGRLLPGQRCVFRQTGSGWLSVPVCKATILFFHYLFIYLFIYYDLLHTKQIHKGNLDNKYSLIHSDEGLTLETSVFESFTVANLPYRPCG